MATLEMIVFRHACKLGLEGIVSKRKDSAYRSGRSPDWLKMKNADAPVAN
jgi:bifunctional non-homologous end joining protein LigD